MVAKSDEVLHDFIGSCNNARRGEPSIWPEAQEDAKHDFNLSTKSDVLRFIGRGRLEDVEFINDEPLRCHKGSPPPPTVYAFSFYSGPRLNRLRGYLAFYWLDPPGRWTIKSFKRNDRQSHLDSGDQQNLALACLSDLFNRPLPGAKN